ncbi:hypothetical protein [Vulcanisaeta distributa]|uniref:Uncharacterized protein n=1 Tax=Vulcanisaeta distributa (strain DSM 14429 / JCM 11212 / NBRC 100878 / IC-017) TaxID=572478 RepID=E1QPG3_VULDI|nr:hypothetical protein [Vulcanisaeta distributa]ADN51451.1 hypothetical protein Vdis_2082 [Vulcanisaeta distributa DSM 14429]
MIPGISIDIVHLMILKLILHAIHDNMKDAAPNPLWLSLAGHISKATFYRKVSELETMGLLERISRNKYLISVSGYLTLLFAYFMHIGDIDQDTAQAAINAIRGNWGLVGFSDYEIESYVKLLYLSSKGRLSSELVALYQEYPRNVFFILPGDLKMVTVNSLYKELVNEYGDPNIVNNARRVIAKALIEYFPTTVINGCRAVTFMSNGEAKVLAMQCNNDFILN